MHRAVPDWGETQSWGPSSSSPKLDDEAIARQLQQQYDREVKGTPGGVSMLEEDSVTVARRLQARTALLVCTGAAWCTYKHSLPLQYRALPDIPGIRMYVLQPCWVCIDPALTVAEYRSFCH